MRGNNSNYSGTSKVSQKSQQNISKNESTILLPRSTMDVTSAQDTIYLCNFRVSVDGEWLCLKELQEGMQTQTIEGAQHDDPKSFHVANDNIVERDSGNYYCRCFLYFLI